MIIVAIFILLHKINENRHGGLVRSIYIRVVNSKFKNFGNIETVIKDSLQRMLYEI